MRVALLAAALAALPMGTAALEDPRLGQVRLLLSRVVADGVSERAAAVARATIGGMLEDADARVLANLVRAGLTIYVIPKDERMTDLPPFAYLKGRRTFDGRLADKVRGAGDVRIPGGVAFAVGEENLVPRGRDPLGYPGRFVLAHELGHAVQDYGLPADDEAVSRPMTFQLFDDALREQGRTALGGYADHDARENFAQAAAAWFGLGEDGATARRLRKAQPGLYALLYKVFGPPRRLGR